MMPKSPHPYARMALTEDEFNLVRGSLIRSRKVVFTEWCAAPKGSDEAAFYERRTNEFDALLAKFDAVLRADTSQDAEPEADDDEEAY